MILLFTGVKAQGLDYSQLIAMNSNSQENIGTNVFEKDYSRGLDFNPLAGIKEVNLSSWENTRMGIRTQLIGMNGNFRENIKTNMFERSFSEGLNYGSLIKEREINLDNWINTRTGIRTQLIAMGNNSQKNIETNMFRRNSDQEIGCEFLIEKRKTRRNNWKRLGMFVASVTFNAVSDGLRDDGKKQWAHIAQVGNIGTLLAIPFVTDIRKEQWPQYLATYAAVRYGEFDYAYNATRGLPMDYLGDTCLYDKFMKKQPAFLRFFSKAVILTGGVAINFREF